MLRFVRSLSFCFFALLLPFGAARAQEGFALSDAAADALVQVVAHEIGHAVIREFDLPILGPEEDMAEDFSVLFVHMLLPGRAEAIVRARALQHLADGRDKGVYSEYRDDDQRAHRNICLLYGQDPERYAGLAAEFNLQGSDARRCLDYPTEVARSWRRVLAPLMLPEGARVTEAAMSFDPSEPVADAFKNSYAAQDAWTLLSAIDWHSTITLRLAQCDGTASWSSNDRRIRICHTYIERFELQLGGLDS